MREARKEMLARTYRKVQAASGMLDKIPMVIAEEEGPLYEYVSRAGAALDDLADAIRKEQEGKR